MPPTFEAQIWGWPITTVSPALADMYTFTGEQAQGKGASMQRLTVTPTHRLGRIIPNVVRCALLLVVGGCATANASKPPPGSPAKANPEVASFRRVLVAGFVVDGIPHVELNEETARFLRMELRSRGMLQVVETEPLRLAPPEVGSNNSRPRKSTDEVFANVPFWKRLGEEYAEPLILTGTVALASVAPQYEEHQVGSRVLRRWRRGARLNLRLVFISGETGRIIDSVTLPPQTVYATIGREGDLALFFRLMDGTMPLVFGAFGQQTNSSRRK